MTSLPVYAGFPVNSVKSAARRLSKPSISHPANVGDLLGTGVGLIFVPRLGELP